MEIQYSTTCKTSLKLPELPLYCVMPSTQYLADLLAKPDSDSLPLLQDRVNVRCESILYYKPSFTPSF